MGTYRKKGGGANNKNLKPSEQKSLLKNLRDALEYKLEVQKWNPITDTYPQKTAEELEIDQLKNMNIGHALEFSLSKMKVATKTRADYSCTVKFVKQAIIKLKISNKYITDINRVYIKLIIEQCKKDRNWTNKSINKHMRHIKSMLSNLIEWEVIEYNPAKNIKSLPVAESNKYEPLTEAEKIAIRDHLFINHYRFFVFIMVIYHTGIRPKEILSLKISDCDLVNNLITIIPEEGRENSKTQKVRKVPINKHLLSFLRELQLQEYERDSYIFGGVENEGAIRGMRIFHPDFFKPSKFLLKRDDATRLWKILIIDGLKINKFMYSLKHTGANDKILAGIDLDAL